MRFTLTYTGDLPAGNRSTAHKEKIRAAMAPQLQALWSHEDIDTKDRHIERYGHTWLPFVSEEQHHRAELDVLMLLPEYRGGFVMAGGDIDNRLKTLFDALSMPQQANQVSADTVASSSEQPHYTLLEDDKLITRINVETDRWLQPQQSSSVVRLVLRVQMRVTRMTWNNIGLMR